MDAFWTKVTEKMRALAFAEGGFLNPGQKQAVLSLARRLPENGVLVADEVGMGKTRIAVAVCRAVLEAQGRVVIVIPPGLGFQWQAELHRCGVDCKPVIRSLQQYYKAWQDDEPWFEQEAVLVSHMIFNWRITSAPQSGWKWQLLAELYARLRKRNTGRFPNGYRDLPGDCDYAQVAADSILKFIDRAEPALRARLARAMDTATWKSSTETDLTRYENFQSASSLRASLEEAIGLGLGAFDLVIIDEAHKNRNEKSKLSNLLNAICEKAHCRRLGLTATPIELRVDQWTQILGRIHARDAVEENLVREYLIAVDKIRKYPEDTAAFQRFRELSAGFEQALRPYILRRDKRAEKSTAKFRELCGADECDYRQVNPVFIDAAALGSDWKQAICAAESLSFIHTDDSVSRRLRLTIANGHGLATREDNWTDEIADAQNIQPPHDSIFLDPFAASPEDQYHEKRAAWWETVLQNSIPVGENSLYNHPEIVQTVSEIEKVCASGEKVLLFGRFISPLRALTELLNAREMLRRLEDMEGDALWPQSRISKWAPVEAAWRQLVTTERSLDRDALQAELAARYKKLQNQRRASRSRLHDKLAEGFENFSHRFVSLYDKFKTEVESRYSHSDDSILGLVDRAMREIAGDNYGSLSAQEIRDAFLGLMQAMTDQDREEDYTESEDAARNPEVAAASWETIKDRLRREFGSPEGSFARLMYGDTAQETRRYMQLAFNRKSSALKVLLSQSMVGREGLNLHQACRTVFLLHPEWNPGVVEQQIGRVDRLGSLWEQMLSEVEKAATAQNLPRIVIRPVIFKGTYDERNWHILKSRWDELRAQLHGIIIAPGHETGSVDPEHAELINSLAPNFSPECQDY